MGSCQKTGTLCHSAQIRPPNLSAILYRKTSSSVTVLAYIQNMRDKDRTGFEIIEAKARGFTTVGIFLFFGATMASLAAFTLLWRGTALDGVWAFNPSAYKRTYASRRFSWDSLPATRCNPTVAGIGWFRHRLWGWRLAIAIIATQVLGDVVNCVRGDFLRGGIGVIIAGGLLLFLLRSNIRAAFA